MESLNHFYTFGDVYETLDACHAVERGLSRLKRQGVLTDPKWAQLTQSLTGIRAALECELDNDSPTPSRGQH